MSAKAKAPGAPQLNSKSPTIRRILREAAELSSAPSPDYAAEPLESDLFEWHFTLRGPPNSSYSEGLYHGRIVLPPSYPLRPPSFRFTTPNGRFETNREICLSISGHHEETWQPAWGLRTAIVALRSFMETNAKGQLGGLETPDAVRKTLAQKSGAFKCSTCGRSNTEIIQESEARAKESPSSQEEQQVEIPKELNMEWRDEMEPKKPTADSASQQAPQAQPSGTDDAELAEGFVRTAPSEPSSQQSATNTPAAPSHRQPQNVPLAPTPTVPLQPRQTVPTRAGHGQNGGVPVWMDRAIAALAILLVAVLIKVLFAM